MAGLERYRDLLNFKGRFAYHDMISNSFGTLNCVR